MSAMQIDNRLAVSCSNIRIYSFGGHFRFAKKSWKRNNFAGQGQGLFPQNLCLLIMQLWQIESDAK
jgi:hypothetical protein